MRVAAMRALDARVSSTGGSDAARARGARRGAAPRPRRVVATSAGATASSSRVRPAAHAASLALRPGRAIAGGGDPPRALGDRARLVACRSGDGRVEQLERQTRRADPVVPTTPSTRASSFEAVDDAAAAAAADANPAKDSSRRPSNDATSSSSPASDGSGVDVEGRRRPPPGPIRRVFLKAKLFVLLALGWGYKSLRSVFSNRWFAALFAIFVVSGAAMGARAMAARRAGARPAAAPVVLYSHFVKDLASKSVRSVRFEEGTNRILYELNPGAKSAAPNVALEDTAAAAREVGASEASKASKASKASSNPPASSRDARRFVLQTKRIPDEKLISRLELAGVDFGSVAAPPSSYLSKGALGAAALWIPLVPLYFFMRNAINKQNGGDAAKKAKRSGKASDARRVTFADVAGVDDAKAELVELVEMLKSAEKYAHVRDRLPTGCLLVGPPGTGKTLLAKAVAGEADVPFFSVAASEFVELFVGRGAARVRELFGEARKQSPAVIFIDELDAIGARRGAGLNEERDQTLNQMLVEMDGFNKPGGVLVLAATNRAEALDPALLRPGRLTRRVFVGPPDADGRARILGVHLRGVTCEGGTARAAEATARATPGFTGAELANVVNEAVLLAARDDREVVRVEDLLAGAERTKNGVGVGQGAGAVLSGLRRLVDFSKSGGKNGGGGGGGGGDAPGGGTGGENISEESKRQGVGLSMPPT